MLNEHLVTTRLKRGFYHLKSAVDQMCGKILVLLPMKRMISLILLLVRHVFRGRSAGGARVGMVCGAGAS